MTAAIVRRDAVRLAQALREEAPAAPQPQPDEGPQTPCTACGVTKELCEGAGPCCEKCSHTQAARAAPAGAPEKPPRVRTFIASDESVDRYNTTIKASGWELGGFTRNPVILFGHEGRALPIGKGRAWVEGNQLRLDVDFLPAELNPMADQALGILDAGLMGVSVGFRPLAWEYNEERETGDWLQDAFFPPLDYTRAELLEVSVVTIPANPNALPAGREAVEARALQRVRDSLHPEARIPIHVAARLVPELVRKAVATVEAEQRAAVARRKGRTS